MQSAIPLALIESFIKAKALSHWNDDHNLEVIEVHLWPTWSKRLLSLKTHWTKHRRQGLPDWFCSKPLERVLTTLHVQAGARATPRLREHETCFAWWNRRNCSRPLGGTSAQWMPWKCTLLVLLLCYFRSRETQLDASQKQRVPWLPHSTEKRHTGLYFTFTTFTRARDTPKLRSLMVFRAGASMFRWISIPGILNVIAFLQLRYRYTTYYFCIELVTPLLHL